MENQKAKYLPPYLALYSRDEEDVITMSENIGSDWNGEYDESDDWGTI